ncbi:MAG: hypothetical protein AAGF89_02155 [Bacteroidota bacterium]
MKYLLILCCCLMSCFATGQASNLSITERANGDGAFFKIKVSPDGEQALVDAFALISETDVNRAFRGHWQTETADGITVKLNTHQGVLLFRYDTPASLTARAAAEKEKVIRQIFNQEERTD